MSKKITFPAEIELVEFEALSQVEQTIIENAKSVSENSYSPYSNFQVGAAVALESGKILQSSNQENVSYPVGVCAERLVLGYAGANFPTEFPTIIGVVAKRKGEESWASVSPCGMCLQGINEVEMRFGKIMTILILRSDGQVFRAQGVKNLLPLKMDDLKS
jgi:cytidine deaminase